MRAGRRDRIVIVERATTTSNALNEEVKTWTEHLTLRAEVVHLKGDELIQFQRQVTSRMIKVTSHYRSDIQETDRLSWDGRYWNIIYVREIGRRKAIELTAEVYS